MGSFSKRLQTLFRDLSVNEAADRTGIDASFMSKLLRGKAKPSAENILRIAFATATPPPALFRLAGLNELAFLAERVTWSKAPELLAEVDLYSARDAGLHRRLQRLLNLGFYTQTSAGLDRLEGAWDILRPAFLEFGSQTGAEAAALIVERHPSPPHVLFVWNCPDPTAAFLATKPAPKEWKRFAHVEREMTLTLYLLRPQSVSPKQAALVLGMWFHSLRHLY